MTTTMKKFEPFQKVIEVLGSHTSQLLLHRKLGYQLTLGKPGSLQGLRTQMGMDLKWDRHYSHLAVE